MVGLHTELGQTSQIATQPVSVDGISAAAAQVGDAPGAQLQQHAGHFTRRTELVVVGLGNLRVVDAADGHKRHTVLIQQVDAGVIRHGAGKDDTINFMACQLAFQLVGVGLTDIAEQQVIPALRSHGADAAHTFAQEGQIQADEVFRDDE